MIIVIIYIFNPNESEGSHGPGLTFKEAQISSQK